MVRVPARAAEHIRKSLSEELDRLNELKQLDEKDQPPDFDVNDIPFIRDMLAEFRAELDIEPSSHSFQSAISFLNTYVKRHRNELSDAEFDELFRIYAHMRAAKVVALVPGGSAKLVLEAIVRFGEQSHET